MFFSAWIRKESAENGLSYDHRQSNGYVQMKGILEKPTAISSSIDT